MVASKMINALGTTYRIEERGDRYEVVRVLDDRVVGAFRAEPVLVVVECEGESEVLLAVAREALRKGKLSWPPESGVRYDRVEGEARGDAPDRDRRSGSG
jgi:hypothetical protein